MFDQQGLVVIGNRSSVIKGPSKQHVFEEAHFSKPTYCSLPSCQKFIWGLTKQGYSCSACHYSTHKRCMDSALETEICPGFEIKGDTNIKKMTLKKKLNFVNEYLERLVPVIIIPLDKGFQQFIEITSSDVSAINSAIPNLFESFRNKELEKEHVVCLLSNLLTAEESVLYFIVSLLEVLSVAEKNKIYIIKCGSVEAVLSKIVPSEGPIPFTVFAPALSFYDELMKSKMAINELLLHVSTSPIQTGALVAATSVGGALEFIARKRNPSSIQTFITNIVNLAKSDVVTKDDVLQRKIANFLAQIYRDDQVKPYMEKCAGHEIIIKAATRQLINIHNEITDAEVRFDFDGLLYDSPLCRVFRGTYHKKKVAIKVFSRDSLGFDPQNFNKEIALMNIIDSDNAVKCYGVNTKGENPFVVMEHFSNGSLNDYVTLNPETIPLRTLVYLMIGAAKGILFLHDKSIIHRDIKTQNFMVSDEFLNCKVIDFGVSRVDTQNAKKTIIGTPVYMAPEIMHGKDYTFSADSYSFGLVMWEMITKNTPYFDVNPMRVAEHILKNRPAVPADCNPLLASIMKSCWSHEPSSRPLFGQIINQLTQFTFALNVKPPAAILQPDLVVVEKTQGSPDLAVVSFAKLHRIIDGPTYTRIFSEISEAQDRCSLMVVCKYWKQVMDDMNNNKKAGQQ